MPNPSAPAEKLEDLLAEVRACRHCAGDLPLGPRPVLRLAPTARLLIVGQAPGTRVHESGIPWNDPSGDRLRGWLLMDRQVFYDAARVAIVPMGFCYPGRDARGGDNPPRPECAPLWHERVLAHLPDLRLTLLVGRYAHARYIDGARRRPLTETVRAWRDLGPAVLPLPHPSWRTTAWQRKNPWFDTDLLPDLRQRVAAALRSLSGT